MRRSFAVPLLLVVAVPGAAADTLVIHNELADDQRDEQVTVRIDDQQAGVLTLDRKKREGQLEIELAPGVHRYRLEGKTVIDGERYAIKGGRSGPGDGCRATGVGRRRQATSVGYRRVPGTPPLVEATRAGGSRAAAAAACVPASGAS